MGCRRGASPSPTATTAPSTLPSVAPVPTPVGPAAPPADTPRSFADLAAKADPAVGFVKTLQEQRGRTGRRRVVGEGLGTGFVYDASGLVLTNNHVIKDATDIRVIIQKKELKATVVGRDGPTDIAVLRVEAKELSHLPLGDSDAARVGDWVVAIGNPFGLSHTVSAGIVSAKGRTGNDVKGLGDGSGYYNFIQTDASINPGNSGGPLLDMAGRVVGINTAIRANANSIGFAIPINMVKELLPRLIKDGKITRSAIGIVVSSLIDEDATRLGLPDASGALVRSVLPGGPADKAGVQADDVITAFEGDAVPSPEKLRWAASLAGVGKTVTLRVTRGKRTFDLKMSLGELPDQDDSREEPPEDPPFGLPPGHP
ncbi:MAG: trypsin-like peptidase domain-containing protein [Myxococcales bacterium]|nr:trypsin-like peptidase domain-containing protein [Myxococcales bacterium]